MGASENLLDLDFTSYVPRPAAAGGRTGARPDAIGLRGAEQGNNLIFYVKPGARAAVPVDAPALVVEDDEVTRRVLTNALAAKGLTVRTAADGKELQQVLRVPPLPALILLDVGLPRVSGFRILSLLRQHPQTSAIPIILVTASAENRDIAQGLALGADGYLSKPLSSATLHWAVDRVLGRAA